jgi:two-component system, chemotaxis family, CheB/CheR fusion protein
VLATDTTSVSQSDMTSSRHLIIGLGASAGGLEAFKNFFVNMPPDSGMAFVLIQHLAPDKKSILAELLRRHTTMEVLEAEEGTEGQPNRVYVIPPDATLTLKDGRLHLEKPAPIRGQRWPVDAFFTSLAEEQGERAVCIILSGGGSDGTIGLKSIKEHGGFTLAQAEHDSQALSGMPQSASATGLVDCVMPVEDMPAKLLQYQQHLNDVEVRKASDGTREDVAHYVAQICSLLQTRTGHDFGQYKQKTLIRRIQRRMQLVQIDIPPDYIRLLRTDSHEAQLLFRDLLINVTQFFRDREAFDALEREVIPKIIDDSRTDDAIRIWAPGCASGEEAYSIAILVKEALDKREAHRKVQIFATDLDDEAVRTARVGRFASSIAADISAERFERWFVQEGDDYCPQKAIREMCIFSVHDILKDPPFSKLDLISCRNLFIYLNSSLQVRLLEAFHYALRPGGYLFLGSSEGVSQQGRLFDVVDKKHRIFQRKNVFASLPGFPLAEAATATPVAARRDRRTESADSFDRLWRQALTLIAPACVVINEQDEIVRYFGQTGRYLEPSPGAASLNLFTVLRPELRSPAKSLLHEVRDSGQRRQQPHLSIRLNGSRQLITLIVAGLPGEGNAGGGAVVAFQEEGPPIPPGGEEKQAENAAEQELRALRAQLSATSADLEAANEELRSSNEEYQSVNEELQSTNEELETAKEELQSINEELQTVNAELSIRNDDLSRANSDMRNFFDSTDIGSLFLDKDLRIKTFTPAMTDLINIRDGDRGRPISDLTGHLIYGDVDSDVRKVMRTLDSIEREVSAQDGTTYMMRIRPYRSIDDVIDGVVMTFVNITGRRRSGAASEQLGLIIEDGFQEVYVCDSETLRFVHVSRSARENLGYSVDELRALGPADIAPEMPMDTLNKRIKRLRAGGKPISYKTAHRRKDGSQYPVDVRLSRVSDPPLIVAHVLPATGRGSG